MANSGSSGSPFRKTFDFNYNDTPIDVLPESYRRRGRIPLDTRAYNPNFLPSGFVLYSLGALAILGGCWILGKTNHERNERKAELRKIRQEVAPILQHEADSKLYDYLWVRSLYEDTYLDELVRSDPHALEEFRVASAPSWNPTLPVYNLRYLPPVEVVPRL